MCASSSGTYSAAAACTLAINACNATGVSPRRDNVAATFPSSAALMLAAASGSRGDVMMAGNVGEEEDGVYA